MLVIQLIYNILGEEYAFMPMKIERIRFQPSNSNKISTKFFEQPKISYNGAKYSAENVSKNINLDSWNKFIFRVIDTISPMAINHPKIFDKLVKIGEKMIKRSGDLAAK